MDRQSAKTLQHKIEGTDVPRYDKFMSYTDTQEAIARIDEVLNEFTHFPRAKQIALVKHSAVHHGIPFALPADCKNTYEEIVRNSKNNAAQQIVRGLFGRK
jgi:hypothetical protein